MTTTIFLVLNGLAVVYLLYVLANFWKEDHRSKYTFRPSAEEAQRRAKVVVVTHPISHAANGGLSVIPFPIRDRERVGEPSERRSTEVSRTAARRSSAR